MAGEVESYFSSLVETMTREQREVLAKGLRLEREQCERDLIRIDVALALINVINASIE